MRAWAIVLLMSACTSNPTPHPGDDVASGGDTSAQTSADSASPDFGPDDDNDGVADCVELNGFWDGEQCDVSAPTADADASDGADTSDVEVVDDASDAGDETTDTP